MREEAMRIHALVAAGCLCLSVPAVAQDKATIQSLNDKFAQAFNAGDAAGLATLYTEEAVILPPGAEMMKGRTAIQAFWKVLSQTRFLLVYTGRLALAGRCRINGLALAR
jgi:hypothetical protein